MEPRTGCSRSWGFGSRRPQSLGLHLDPNTAVEAAQRCDGVGAYENEVVDACGAPCMFEFPWSACERDTLNVRRPERSRERFRLRCIGVVGPAQADEQRAAQSYVFDRLFGRCGLTFVDGFETADLQPLAHELDSTAMPDFRPQREWLEVGGFEAVYEGETTTA